MSLETFSSLSGADKNDQEDNSILALGYATILVYVLLTVGRCNCVENRTVLSLCGLACIGMGLATCYGICAALGLPSTQMNTIVPFLLLGIGVDNMFVIVQCFNNLNEEEKLLPLHTRYVAERFRILRLNFSLFPGSASP